jgi:polyisoprenoid-binding protein YceI
MIFDSISKEWDNLLMRMGKKMRNTFFAAAGILALVLSTTSVSFAQDSASSAQDEQTQEKCTFNLDPNSVIIGFTAYKTTKKVGVSGTFKKTKIRGKTSAASVEKLVKGISVAVDYSSLDTGNPVRDKTVGEYFFSKLKPSVSGKIKSISEADKTLVLDLNFNGMHKDVAMTYAATDDQNFQATGSIELPDFGAEGALASIHEKCKELHKGPDGVSKTWPDVTLNLKGSITKVCQ